MNALETCPCSVQGYIHESNLEIRSVYMEWYFRYIYFNVSINFEFSADIEFYFIIIQGNNITQKQIFSLNKIIMENFDYFTVRCTIFLLIGQSSIFEKCFKNLFPIVQVENKDDVPHVMKGISTIVLGRGWLILTSEDLKLIFSKREKIYFKYKKISDSELLDRKNPENISSLLENFPKDFTVELANHILISVNHHDIFDYDYVKDLENYIIHNIGYDVDISSSLTLNQEGDTELYLYFM